MSGRTYTIQKGDKLDKIAKKNIVADPKKVNADDNLVLYLGDNETRADHKRSSLGDATSGYQYEDFEHDVFSYGNYQESEAVKQASAALQAQMAAKPGEYQSQWQGQINDIINRIQNREDFSYDVNSDALYQQYKDQYTALGKMAMQDTMGQAAAMTGGFGNSYAASAGSQAFQQYLSQLNEVVPELYGMALDKYNAEGQELYNQYGLLADQEDQNYARYQDTYNQWASERDYLQGVYNDERSFDYGKYADARDFAYGQYSDNRNLAYDEHSTKQSLGYQQYRDTIEDQQWQKEFKESRRQFNTTLAENKRQFNTTLAENKRQFNEQMSLSRQQYEEAKDSGNEGSNNAALEHVSSMSSAELVETMEDYSYEGNNTGLAAFLDDCVASGRLTPSQADAYYEKYRKGDTDDVVDTTVEPITKGPKTKGGGAGVGRWATQVMIKE